MRALTMREVSKIRSYFWSVFSCIGSPAPAVFSSNTAKYGPEITSYLHIFPEVIYKIDRRYFQRIFSLAARQFLDLSKKRVKIKVQLPSSLRNCIKSSTYKYFQYFTALTVFKPLANSQFKILKLFYKIPIVFYADADTSNFESCLTSLDGTLFLKQFENNRNQGGQSHGNQSKN